MPILEAAPEIATQAQEEALASAGDRPAGVPPEVDQAMIAERQTQDMENHPTFEAPPNMTPEQAIIVCPYLGNLAAQNPEQAKQKAQEYISDPEKMAQLHPDQEADEIDQDEADSFWDDLEAEFSADEVIDEDPSKEPQLVIEPEPIPEAESEPASVSIPVPDPVLEQDLSRDSTSTTLPDLDDALPATLEAASISVSTPEPEVEGVPVIPQLEIESAATQEEIRSKQFLDDQLSARHRKIRSKENSDHGVSIDAIVGNVIAANHQICEAFRNGDRKALDTLVSEAMRVSETQ